MLLSTLRSLGFAVILSVIYARVSDASVATNWTNPNGNLPSFSSTYLNGERIILSWLALNKSTDDLWLTRYDKSTDTFTLRIASQIDISAPGSFAWQIAVSDNEVLKDTRFALQFQPTGINYDGNQSILMSPAFNLMLVNQASLPNGTVSAVRTSTSDIAATTTSLSPTTTSTTSGPDIPLSSNSAKHDSGISSGVIGGVVAAAASVVIGIAGFGIGYWWFKRRQKHKDQKDVSQTGVDIQGPYEILADRRHPTELNSKEAHIHEMMDSRETISTEADSPVVYEVSNTVRRPGLHEMPG